MQTLTFRIGGMTCGGCARSVSTVLNGLNGVVQAEVSLERAQAEVVFDPERISPAGLAAAVEDAGFDAAL